MAYHRWSLCELGVEPRSDNQDGLKLVLFDATTMPSGWTPHPDLYAANLIGGGNPVRSSVGIWTDSAAANGLGVTGRRRRRQRMAG